MEVQADEGVREGEEGPRRWWRQREAEDGAHRREIAQLLARWGAPEHVAYYAPVAVSAVDLDDDEQRRQVRTGRRERYHARP